MASVQYDENGNPIIDPGSVDLSSFALSPGDLAFVAPALPETIVSALAQAIASGETATTAVATGASYTAPEIIASLASSLAPVFMFAVPAPIAPEPSPENLQPFDFTPIEVPEVKVVGKPPLTPPPPLDVTTFDTPPLPPNWNDLANPGDKIFGKPETPKNLVDWLIESVNLSTIVNVMDQWLTRPSDIGAENVPEPTRIEPLEPLPGIGPEPVVARPSRIDPTGTVGYGYASPGASSLDVFADALAPDVYRSPLGAPSTVPRGVRAPEPAPFPLNPTRLDPFSDPILRPGTEPLTPVSQPPTTLSPVSPFEPVTPFLDPLNPTGFYPGLDPNSATPETQPQPEAAHCNCAQVKTKTKPDKKKKRKTARSKCFEYRNRQYADGTVRVETTEIPCEPKKGRPRKTRSDKGKKRAPYHKRDYGKPGRFPGLPSLSFGGI